MLGGIVDRFRAVEDDIGVALIIGDVEATKVLALWSRFPYFAWEPPERSAPADDADDNLWWEWVWEGFTADYERLAQRAGIEADGIDDVVQRLIAARAVYPDGSISGFGRLAVNAYVASHLPRRATNRKPKKDEVKK